MLYNLMTIEQAHKKYGLIWYPVISFVYSLFSGYPPVVLLQYSPHL